MRTAFVYLGISLLSGCGGTEQMAGGMDPGPTDTSPDAGMDAVQPPIDRSFAPGASALVARFGDWRREMARRGASGSASGAA